jgi:hypothetical protein
MIESGAVELDLVGIVEAQFDADAIAQHYGFPTNLVDFTWDPLTALYFACAVRGEEACRRSGLPLELESHRAVYCTSLVHLMAAGQVKVRFPPVQLRRLYRQKGIFIDYGGRQSDCEEEPRKCGFAPTWSHVEKNCMLILFPGDDQADGMRTVLNGLFPLSDSGFLAQVVAQLPLVPVSPESECPLETQVALKVSARPPWRVRASDAFIYTDDEFESIANILIDYIQFSMMVCVGGSMMLDPFIVRQMVEWDERILVGIREISAIPSVGKHVLRIREMIDSAISECTRWKTSRQKQRSIS